MIQDYLTTLNIPPRNFFFIGRKEILESINSRFNEETETTRMIAICGLAGIGKTQIALEYAHHYYNHYDAFLWINASSKDTFESGMLTIARILNLSETQEKDIKIVIAAVHRWLRQCENWLLVLDDIKDEQLLNSFIPSIERGCVLITTQLHSISGIPNIEVKKMSDNEGALFLLRRARIIASNRGDDENLIVHYPEALQITQIMGGLPLALDQAGAFIEATSCGLSGYLTRYKKQSAELLKLRGGLYADDNRSVSSQWSMSIKNMAETPFALDVLRLCAFLDSESIPEELILRGVRFFNQNAVPDPAQVSAAIEVLCKFSLLRVENKNIHDKQMKVLSIHPLMQEILRAELNVDTKRQYAEYTILAVAQLFPSIEFENWDICQIYLPHARVCIKYIEDYDIASEEAAHLIHETAYYLFERVLYDKVEDFYQRAWKIQEKILGPEDKAVAKTLHNLALFYREQGNYNQAEKLFEEASRIREKSLGLWHVLTASSLHQLGWIYSRLARYDQAERLLIRALEIRQQELPYIHQGLASSYNELGHLYRHIAQYDKAKKFLEDALDIRMKLAHPHFANTLVDLAWLYFEQGDLKNAEAPLSRALLIQKGALSPNHPRIAKTLTKLGLFYCVYGRFELAEDYHRQALTIRKEVLPEDHPDLAESYDSLGLLYYHRALVDEAKKRFEEAQAKYRDAERWYQDALKIRQKMLGPTHPETTQTLNHLGLLYLAQGEYEYARKLFEEALQARKATLGETHPHVVSSLNYLAQLFVAQGDYAKAETLLLAAQAICNELRIEHPQIAGTLENLADLYVLLRRYEEASALYEQVIPIYETKLVPNHPRTVEILKKRAELLEREGDNTGALELQQPIEALIDILKERATFLRSKGDDIGASELEQRIKALQA